MNLKIQSVADAAHIVQDAAAFGWPVVVTSPEGLTATLSGQTNDVAAMIDPATGVVVSGRKVSCTLSIQSLADAGLGLPKNVAEKSSKPWRVAFADASGAQHVFKVAETLPDATLGIVVLKLEAFAVVTGAP